MKKNTNLCINLKTVMHNDVILKINHCYNGVLSRDADDHFRFEEAAHKGRAPRNPKLFDGDFVSMVRMQNGKYQLHLKTMKDDFDKDTFASSVHTEICNALKIID